LLGRMPRQIEEIPVTFNKSFKKKTTFNKSFISQNTNMIKVFHQIKFL
jgi:hypothetical protein